MVPIIPKRAIERSLKELIELHKRVLTQYLIQEDVKFRTRKKFFQLYDMLINKDNIKDYFFAPSRLFIRAIVQNSLDSIKHLVPKDPEPDLEDQEEAIVDNRKPKRKCSRIK